MVKYRRLSTEELSELEQIFINFLAANSITSQDWEKIKTSDTERMDKLIEEFSDVVFEKTLSNVKLLEKRLSKKILMYRFTDKTVILEGIEASDKSPMDFRNEFNFSDITNLLNSPDVEVSFIEGTKPYFEDKNKEIFDLMESGAMISQNEVLFDALIKLKEEYSEE